MIVALGVCVRLIDLKGYAFKNEGFAKTFFEHALKDALLSEYTQSVVKVVGVHDLHDVCIDVVRLRPPNEIAISRDHVAPIANQ